MTDRPIEPSSYDLAGIPDSVYEWAKWLEDEVDRISAALTQSRAETAAAYERAAERFPDGRQAWPPVNIRKAIRALATTEQTAALDAVREEARAQGMQPLIDAASAVVDAMNAPDKPWDLPSRVLRELIDAIKGAKA